MAPFLAFEILAGSMEHLCPRSHQVGKRILGMGGGFADHGVSVGSGAILEQTGEPLEGPEHRVGIM